jgi:hypothetical protein
MLKKFFKSFMCLTLSIFLLSPSVIQAAEKAITMDTVVTEDNYLDVLNYLGIDTSTVTDSDNTAPNYIQTVGDIKELIDHAKDQKKDNVTSTVISSEVLIDPMSTFAISATSPVYGSKLLFYTANCDGYVITNTVSASYRTSYWSGTYEQTYHPPIWTGAYVQTPTCDTTSNLFVYKIGTINTYTATYDAFKITLIGNFTVDQYLQISGSINSMFKVGSQTVSTGGTWNVAQEVN